MDIGEYNQKLKEYDFNLDEHILLKQIYDSNMFEPFNVPNIYCVNFIFNQKVSRKAKFETKCISNIILSYSRFVYYKSKENLTLH